jgi:hypothetical protein
MVVSTNFTRHIRIPQSALENILYWLIVSSDLFLECPYEVFLTFPDRACFNILVVTITFFIKSNHILLHISPAT